MGLVGETLRYVKAKAEDVFAYAWQMLKEIGAVWRSMSFDPLLLLTAVVAGVIAAIAVFLGQSTSDDITQVATWLVLAEPFAPYAAAVVALLAGVVAVAGLAQRHRADKRAEWWRRAQYGIDLVRDVDKVGRNAGLELLTSLLDDRRWHKVDVRTLQSVVSVLTDEVVVSLTAVPEAPPTPSPKESVRSRLAHYLAGGESS